MEREREREGGERKREVCCVQKRGIAALILTHLGITLRKDTG